MLIGKEELCGLIPHAGTMCLLDGVESWTEEGLVCLSNTHRAPDNPLRSGGMLPVVSAIEYGAQAMAVHGALLARAAGTKLPGGYLAAVRDARFETERLDDIDQTLTVTAQRLVGGAGNFIYAISINAGARVLVTARVTVIEQPEEAQ